MYPSSEACDYSVALPHWSYCSWFDVCWSFGVVGVVSVLQASASHKILITSTEVLKTVVMKSKIHLDNSVFNGQQVPKFRRL